MSLKDHAKRELALAGLFDKDSDYAGMIGHAVMKMIESDLYELPTSIDRINRLGGM